eukprot:261109-Prorocentrum_minimum.AAC.1
MSEIFQLTQHHAADFSAPPQRSPPPFVLEIESIRNGPLRACGRDAPLRDCAMRSLKGGCVPMASIVVRSRRSARRT